MLLLLSVGKNGNIKIITNKNVFCNCVCDIKLYITIKLFFDMSLFRPKVPVMSWILLKIYSLRN